jgi:YVTN family beta-propeller protein
MRKTSIGCGVLRSGLPLLITAWMSLAPSLGSAAAGYQIFVSNEKSENVSVINGSDFTVTATIPVGKRPRGVQTSPDGKTVYVALSGTPVKAPPQLDAKGNPIFKSGKKDDDDDDDVAADKAADGVGVIDVAAMKLTKKLNAGSDPEEFALSRDGKHIYISNEDVKTASVINIAANKVEAIIPIGQEPEGVATTPDGKQFYVTCEASGEIFVIDATTYKVVTHFKINGRPRSADFLRDAAIGFVPSESTGELNIIDTAAMKVLKTIALPPGSRPMRVRVSADGKKLYLSEGRAGTISVIDAHSYAVTNTIKVGARPWGTALSPDGKYLFSANGPSDDVSVVDLSTEKEIAKIKVGSSPWGVTIAQAPQ